MAYKVISFTHKINVFNYLQENVRKYHKLIGGGRYKLFHCVATSCSCTLAILAGGKHTSTDLTQWVKLTTPDIASSTPTQYKHFVLISIRIGLVIVFMYLKY
jgi:hypothetical protein